MAAGSVCSGYHFPFLYFKIIWGEEGREGLWQRLLYRKKFWHSEKLTCSKLKQPISGNFQFLRENYKIKLLWSVVRYPVKTSKFIWEKLAWSLMYSLKYSVAAPKHWRERHHGDEEHKPRACRSPSPPVSSPARGLTTVTAGTIMWSRYLKCLE